MNYYLGIDFGTSGVKSAVINSESIIKFQGYYPLDNLKKGELIYSWENALWKLLGEISGGIRAEIKGIAINGTSSTVMLCDDLGNPLQRYGNGKAIDSPLLYNYACDSQIQEQIKQIAPPNHTVLSATSSLAKLVQLFWTLEKSSFSEDKSQSKYFLHQADWLGFLLHGKLGISDYHNALKLGYDVEKLEYPDWLLNYLQEKLQVSVHLPEVLAPGTVVGKLKPDISSKFGFSPDCVVCAGTTDSIAAFFASGAKSPGEAVTSLGSTLVLKLLSRTRVEDAKYGIYSHRFPSFNGEKQEELWLAGGASNTGGAVLKQFFSKSQLESLSSQIDLTKTSKLDYYPLVGLGERFPISDPNLKPRLAPRPDNDVEFLHGLFESMARIESQGYRLLQELGADDLTRVYTAGGGAANDIWRAIRERHLGVSVVRSDHVEAAYGTALLAMSGSQKNT
ncbi:MAG: FGGY-family carbohydrate kinase [Cyanobacteria bacterium P01_A01_bin.45]